MEHRIVVLDGYTANPGDLDWAALEALAPLTVYDRTPPPEVVGRCRGADIVLTNKTVLGAAEIGALPDLRYIGVLATGYNVVDVDAARQAGVVVTNVPAYSTRSVAQAVFALLLELTNDVGALSAGVRAGRWSASPDFAYWHRPLVELAGKTLGVVGMGQIGRAVAGVGRALGMEVVAAVHTGLPDGFGWVEVVDVDGLFRCSDVVTLHCPLTPETRNLADARRIASMKPSAYLINTSRGPVVDETALALALREGRIAGAGLDVLSAEPPPADNPLLDAPNCVITPHVAWATREARTRLTAVAAQNVRAFLAGRPVNVVS